MQGMKSKADIEDEDKEKEEAYIASLEPKTKTPPNTKEKRHSKSLLIIRLEWIIIQKYNMFLIPSFSAKHTFH
jgi:hypothetical protein